MIKGKASKSFLAGTLLILLNGCEYIDDLPVGARYIAKNICSGLFVSGYDEDLLINDYVTNIVPSLKPIWNIDIDRQARQVRVSDKIFKLRNQALAVYRPGLGCVNQRGESAELLQAQADFPLLEKELPHNILWPYGSGGVDSSLVSSAALSALSELVDDEFVNPEGKLKHTTGVVIVKDGNLVMERYAGGLTALSPVKGFSMSKSLVNALAGLLYDQGRLDIDQSSLFEEWQETGKAAITLGQLMHMTSGLQYVERAIGDDNDQGMLLYGKQQPFEFMSEKTLVTTPGEIYNYSSGDNLIAAHWLQNQINAEDDGDREGEESGTENSVENTYRMYQQSLFHAVDITTAVVEHSGDGYMLAPESLMLSVRDWARLGLLYKDRGSWDGQQILSKEWMEYSLRPAEANPSYGAFLWLNTGQWFFEDLPEDTIAFVGAMERYVIIIPSLGLIVVRVGFSYDKDTVDINRFVKTIADALSSDS